MASFVAFLDGSVVNVALPAIAHEVGGGLATQQWVVDAYLITLGSLILLAGSLSDLFGRKRILRAGLIGFGLTSVLCAVAPSGGLLIAFRALQGATGALLVPSSLALIMSTFSGSAQSKAIGTWTAWTGISFVVGPLLGGLLVDTLSWRLIFGINVLPIAVCLAMMRGLPPHERTERAKIDVAGALLCSLGLFGAVFGLIEQPHHGWLDAATLTPLLGGLLLLAGFIWHESRAQSPMLPLSLFHVRNFWAGNAATLAIYGALSSSTFLITIFLQQVGGYSALMAGLALTPITIVMFFLSSRFGALAGRFGPRFFMAGGPAVISLSLWVLSGAIGTGEHYWTHVLPGVLIFALGLSMTVAPLTSAVLGDIEPRRAGIASAVNNAVARIAGLVTVAAVGVIAGGGLDAYGFRRAIIASSLLMLAGGVMSGLWIRNHQPAAE